MDANKSIFITGFKFRSKMSYLLFYQGKAAGLPLIEYIGSTWVSVCLSTNHRIAENDRTLQRPALFLLLSKSCHISTDDSGSLVLYSLVGTAENNQKSAHTLLYSKKDLCTTGCKQIPPWSRIQTLPEELASKLMDESAALHAALCSALADDSKSPLLHSNYT